MKSPGADDDMRKRSGPFSEDGLRKLSATDTISQGSELRNILGAIANDEPGKLRDDGDDQSPDVIDPLAGMAEVDKWGIKGLRTLMNNYPDYHAMVVGMDPNSLGLDMSSQE